MNDDILSPLIFTAEHEPSPRLRGDASLTRVRRGIYAPRDEWAALPPWERYRARIEAFARLSPRSIFAHESAACLLGLPMHGEPRDIHVFDPRRTRSRRFGDVVVHTSGDPRATDSVNGIPVTALPDTLLDLGRSRPPAFALTAWDAALREFSDIVQLDELSALWRSHANLRGNRHLRWLEQHATPLAESPAESVSRAVIEWLGYEPPQLQAEFRFEDARDRTDFFWRSDRVVGEVDGFTKYGEPGSDFARAAFRAEKRREDRLRRNGLTVVRWEYADVLAIEPLRMKLRAAGLYPRFPVRDSLLATLPQVHRSERQNSAVPDVRQRGAEKPQSG